MSTNSTTHSSNRSGKFPDITWVAGRGSGKESSWLMGHKTGMSFSRHGGFLLWDCSAHSPGPLSPPAVRKALLEKSKALVVPREEAAAAYKADQKIQIDA